MKNNTIENHRITLPATALMLLAGLLALVLLSNISSVSAESASVGGRQHNQNQSTVPTRTITPTPETADLKSVPVMDIPDTKENAEKLIVGESYCPSDSSSTVFPQTFSGMDDQDYFKFFGKANQSYQVIAKASSSSELPAIDPDIAAIEDDDGVNKGSDQDESRTSLNAKVSFIASSSGFHSVLVKPGSFSNDNANHGYCVEITVVDLPDPPAPTPTPTSTPIVRIPVNDECEDNWTFANACIIGLADGVSAGKFTFVPLEGNGPDHDYFRIRLKGGTHVSCSTRNLSSVNDTNMIVYGPDQQGIGGNDNVDPPRAGVDAEFNFYVPKTDTYYILVGPDIKLEIPYEDSAKFTYELFCEPGEAPTPVPTAIPPTPIPAVAVAPAGANQPPPVINISNPTDAGEDSGESAAESAPIPKVYFEPIVIATAVPVSRTSTTYRPVTIKISLQMPTTDANGKLSTSIQPISNLSVLAFPAQGDINQLLARGNTKGSGEITFDIDIQISEIVLKIPYFPFEKRVTVDDKIDLVFGIES